MNKFKTGPFLFIVFFCLLALIVLNIFIGAVKIPVNRMFEPGFFEILKLRLFRALLAVAVGAGLSVAGVILQTVLRNPLAEPYVLGYSMQVALIFSDFYLECSHLFLQLKHFHAGFCCGINNLSWISLGKSSNWQSKTSAKLKKAYA